MKRTDIIDKDALVPYISERLAEYGELEGVRCRKMAKYIADEINDYVKVSGVYFGMGNERLDIEKVWRKRSGCGDFLHVKVGNNPKTRVGKSTECEFLWNWFIECFGEYALKKFLEIGK